MAKYKVRLKEVTRVSGLVVPTVDAACFDGSARSAQAVASEVGGCEVVKRGRRVSLVVHTADGAVAVPAWGWVVKDAADRRHVIEADVFEAGYEPA